MTSVTFCAYDKPDNVGGPVTWLQRLAPQLKELGFNVRCLFIMHYGDTGPALSSLTAAGIECSCIAGLDRTEDRVRWILSELKKNPPDVFVPNLVVAAYYASRWVRESGIPTVGILHSDDPFYHALQTDFVSGSPENRVSALVCVSSELREQAVATGPDNVDFRRIPYGVAIPRESVQRSAGCLRLAYVGRLAEEQKRIGDVVRAFCAAATQLDGVDATIYGDGPDRDAVERALARDGSGLPVSLAGLIDSDRMHERLLEADAIVLLSDYEGLPIALLEAMACGCVPVVSDMKSGIPELVEDGVTGLIVRDRKAAFVDTVKRLRDDPELWARLSHAAREHVRRNYSSDASADQWADLLRELAAMHRDSRSIETPVKFSLPRVNPALASADIRIERRPLLLRAYSRARMKLGAVRRRLLGHP